MNSAPHYHWGELCDSWVLLESGGLSVKQERMPADTKEEWHIHRQAQQFFYVLKGSAVFYLGDQRLSVHQGQGLHVYPGMRHCISNESENDLEFLVISQPSTQNDRVNG